MALSRRAKRCMLVAVVLYQLQRMQQNAMVFHHVLFRQRQRRRAFWRRRQLQRREDALYINQRQHLLMCTQVAAMGLLSPQIPRLLAQPKTVPNDFYRGLLSSARSDAACLEALRMSPRVWFDLLGLLQERSSTWRRIRSRPRVLIDPGCLLAAVLYTLFHGCSINNTSRVFGISKTHINDMEQRFLLAVLEALNDHPVYRIKLPETDEEVLEETTRWSSGRQPGDTRFSFLRGCIGAGDGVHIPFRPREQGNHLNLVPWRYHKGYYSTNLLVIANHNKTFSWTAVGAEGQCHDQQVIDNSDVLAQLPPRTFVLFDAGGTLSERMLTPFCSTAYHLTDFADGHMPRTPQEAFNLRHSSKRCRVEIAIGLLKARFGILRHGMICSRRLMTLRIHVCTLLHNFIQLTCGKDDVYEQVVAKAVEDDKRFMEEQGHAYQKFAAWQQRQQHRGPKAARTSSSTAALTEAARWRMGLANQTFGEGHPAPRSAEELAQEREELEEQVSAPRVEAIPKDAFFFTE
eukprot:m.134143 g.134143  ORF g.134143 m.134143 type:complete len:517 (+) comp16909_c0_seq1:990-2540(+)